MSQKVLVVEDDNNIAELLRLYLQKDGFEVSHAADGGKAVEMAKEIQPDLVLLDIMLPVMDGWQVCRELRKTMKMPIIMLTAKGETEDKVSGLEMGKKLTFDKLVINLDSYELIVDGKKIDTPPKEMELLYHLAATPNRVYTRNQLLDEVWGFDYFGDSRTVDVHIKRLREKLEGVSDKWALKTVWGVGYKFEAEET